MDEPLSAMVKSIALYHYGVTTRVAKVDVGKTLRPHHTPSVLSRMTRRAGKPADTTQQGESP
jgi:hypothetical protein